MSGKWRIMNENGIINFQYEILSWRFLNLYIILLIKREVILHYLSPWWLVCTDSIFRGSCLITLWKIIISHARMCRWVVFVPLIWKCVSIFVQNAEKCTCESGCITSPLVFSLVHSPLPFSPLPTKTIVLLRATGDWGLATRAVHGIRKLRFIGESHGSRPHGLAVRACPWPHWTVVSPPVFVCWNDKPFNFSRWRVNVFCCVWKRQSRS